MMDETDSAIDPQAEVKKLQDLVKKLEKQNEVLRDRQKLQLESLQNGEVDEGKILTIQNNNFSEKIDKTRPKIKGIATLDDIDVLDVDQMSIKEDEDSWLYSSPKPPTPLQNRVSPYKWVRQEFDHPSPELESARRSLIHKLDEAARMSRSSSTPTFGSYSANTPRSYSRMSQSAESTPAYNKKPAARKTLISTMGANSNRIDTGTFTRPKKNKEVPQPDEVPKQESEKHPEVSDIENLAKQQEESLRQSLSHSSPRRGDRRNSQSNSIGSDASSPPDSPYGSQYLNQSNQENSHVRRSLPNVSQRLTPTSNFHSSDPYLDNHSSGGSDDYEQQPQPLQQRQYSRLQPPVRPVSPNVTGLRQPSTPVRRGLSPQRTGLPQPARRTIPRPGSAGKTGVPSPRRSGLPSPRQSNAYRSPGGDESWKEGCF